MFNPAKAADEIKKEFIGYISTTFHFRDAEIQDKLLSELNKTVSNGPFVEIKDTFVEGKSLRSLIDDGVLSPLFEELEKNKPYKPRLPISRPLYAHQEKAIRKIVAGKNIVVSTGTGSGKTNCFIIPVINELLREKEAGTLNDGVRAIFIYPMNALANDQIKGLREILMSYPDITFGVYNGGTEHKEEDAIKLYEAMYANEKYPELRKRLDNELLSREEMKKKPPHILFTNYAMLEHMLFRPGDDALFSQSNFKFVVLDEAHVYAGATGIETALLISRLKGRLGGCKSPQFILTSATLGDQSKESNVKVADFANRLTGVEYSESDIIVAERNRKINDSANTSYPSKLYIDLANNEKPIKEILDENGIKYKSSADEEEIIYDLIAQTALYSDMRSLGDLISLDEFSYSLSLSKEAAVAFVALCAKARKSGKPLVDIRYHYFLRALDGGYMALDYPQSFTLTRRDTYKDASKMFEIAVCDDCGEIALMGKIENGHLVRVNSIDERELFQIADDSELEEFDDVQLNDEELSSKSNGGGKYVLCKSCGAIVELNKEHKNWCTCGNTNRVTLNRIEKSRCLNCGGNLRRLQLGYDAATGVIATSLFEQIPEYSFALEEDKTKSQTKGLFSSVVARKRIKEKTGSQFLIFSDSRQGAAKFACFLEDTYKEFLRRRGIWNIASKEAGSYPHGLSVSEFVRLLENYFSSLKLFRESNADNAVSSVVENRRNAWVAVLNELYNSNRDTSLVSLGKIKFVYLGNTDDIVDVVVEKYNVNKDDARNFLNFLALEVVRAGAVITDKDTDINDEDRKYIYFTQVQKVITKNRDASLSNSTPFLPTSFPKKNGEITFYRQRKFDITKNFLRIGNNEAVEFLEEYWNWLTANENEHHLLTKDGKGFYMQASSIQVYLGEQAVLWKCNRCKKVTQFNINSKCLHPHCNGELEKLNSTVFCKDNYYAMLYDSDKLAPLFVKEHTAQLAKQEALEYQQQFVRKEINALSCSTTFEMGVDVGDLETVFLRNIPPLASNYAQRVGRAGRSINAAAFALTYARLSSHDFTFFDRPHDMINGTIYPPMFKLGNEKIIKRHIYAVALSLYLKLHPDLYQCNNAKAFINDKGYVDFLQWLNTKPNELKDLLKLSIPYDLWNISGIEIESFGWLNDFCGEQGRFKLLIQEYESNIKYLQKELDKALKAKDTATATVFEQKLVRYQKNDLIDFLVRGNILPKYGFPVDSVELAQNITSKDFKSLNLSRDLSVAIAEYAPSAEVVADGQMYTSRYIRKPIVNKNETENFDISYIAECPDCQHINYRNMPVGIEGQPCIVCGRKLRGMDFRKSIEPRAGFIAEKDSKPVPLSSQERKYKTEAIYIGDTEACQNEKYTYQFGKTKIIVESTSNDSLVVKSTEGFYVCRKCGYAIACDETSKLNKYRDYKRGVRNIQTGEKHLNPFGKGECENTELELFWLHHEFKTDVAKITFETDTSDLNTMLSVMYSLLNAFADVLSIEKRDIKACLTYKFNEGTYSHKIIIYDAVPGGAGHSRRLVTQDGAVLRQVIKKAIQILGSCNCEPSCYRCLRNYENQKIHEILDRKKALNFLVQLMGDDE